MNGATHPVNRWPLDKFVLDALVIPFPVIVRDELSKQVAKVSLAERHDAIEDSALIDRTKRSACALQCGAAGGARITRTPTSVRSTSIARLHFGSRSQIRTRPAPSTSRPIKPRNA